MKKRTQKGFTLLLFAFISVISFSQTREEISNTLARHFKEAKIHAKKIGEGLTQAEEVNKNGIQIKN